MSEQLISFLDLLNAAMDASRIVEESCAFLVKQFKLANCAVFFARKEHSYFTLNKELASTARVIADQAVRDNAFVLVRNPATDPLTSKLSGAKQFSQCLLAFPLLVKKRGAGALVLVAERDLSPEVSKISVLVKRISVALARAKLFSEVQQNSFTDALTGLYNKAYFVSSLKNEVERAKRTSRPISLLFFDFDNFKEYNDTHGHVAGDELLRQVGMIVKQNVRAIDVPCRFGGEEFAVVLPETTHEQAFATAERLRNSVQKNCNTSISVGAITCLNASAPPETLLKEADNALYKAKKQGKNRTVSFIMVDKALGVIDVNDASNLGRS